jgi:hypothetical protein
MALTALDPDTALFPRPGETGPSQKIIDLLQTRSA